MEALKKKPELIIIEGIHRSWGLNSSNWDLRLSNSDQRGKCDTYYGLRKAKELAIDYLGIEPGSMKDFSSYDRDIQFVKELEKLSKQYEKIMVIYGAGHYVQQELVLKSMFGNPVSVH